MLERMFSIRNRLKPDCVLEGRQQKRKGSYEVILLWSLLIGFLFTALMPSVLPLQAASSESESSSQTDFVMPEGKNFYAPAGKAYVLYDSLAQVFLWGENPDVALPPASMAKVLTVLLALENLPLDQEIAITASVYSDIPEGYVRLGVVEGEKITVEQAIYATLLISANDAANALALSVSGNYQDFADLMNQKAQTLGCTSSHFTNPYGFEEADNYTSAHDLALILSAALQNQTFRQIATTTEYTIPVTNKYSRSRTLSNGNRFVKTQEYTFDSYVGGKTGYTETTGYSISAGSQKSERLLIGVILGAESTESRYNDLVQLFNAGFSNSAALSIKEAHFAEPIKQIQEQIHAALDTSGYNLEIAKETLSVKPHIVVASALAEQPYTTETKLDGAVILADQPQQQLIFPLLIKYDGNKSYEVGSFTVILATPEVAQKLAEEEEEKVPIWVILRQVILIAGLIGLFLVVLLIFLRMNRKRNFRLGRKDPKVL